MSVVCTRSVYLQLSRSFRNAPSGQNIHLVAKWLARLDKKLEQYSEGSNKAYRVYMSAEPAGSREGHIIPQGILECSIKITNEPPTGMRANLHKALDNFTQVTCLRVCTCVLPCSVMYIYVLVCYMYVRISMCCMNYVLDGVRL